MPELLLRDEQQTTGKWEEEFPSKPEGVYIDTSAILQYYRYVDYFLRQSEIRSPLYYKLGGEEENFQEYILGESLPTPSRPFAPTLSRRWPYHSRAIWIVGTASELIDVESYEIKEAQPTKATIAAVLSQTMEFLGHALPKQLGLSIEPAAFKLLENSTLASLTHKVLAIIASEKRRGTPIGSVSVTSFKDREAINFEQLVLKVYLDSDSDTALRIWDNLSRDIEDLKKDLSPHEIDVLDERLGLDCEW